MKPNIPLQFSQTGGFHNEQKTWKDLKKLKHPENILKTPIRFLKNTPADRWEGSFGHHMCLCSKWEAAFGVKVKICSPNVFRLGSVRVKGCLNQEVPLYNIVTPSPASYTSGHWCSLTPAAGRKTSGNDSRGWWEHTITSLARPLLAFTARVMGLEGRNRHTEDFLKQC